MTQNKTKKAILMSVLSMVLCVAMLVGMTFAWFTDTASTGVNKIVAGNLDVVLYYADNATGGEEPTWTKLDNNSPALNFLQKQSDGTVKQSEGILWEPGCTYELPAIKIVNEGNLALKYKIQITGISGDAELNKVIDWTMILDNEVFELSNEQKLAAKTADTTDSDILTICGHMQETANNYYQGKHIDGIAITVVATQLASEFDSIGNDYDKDATYPVTSNADLSEALTNISSGETLAIAAGTYALPASDIPERVGISGAGVDKTTLMMPAMPYGIQGKKTGLKINNAGVTISNAEVSGDPEITSSDSYCAFIDVNAADTVIDNVVINNNTEYTSSIVVNQGVKKGSTVQISNVVLNGGFKPIHIVDGANGTVNIDKTEITATYTLNVNSGNSQDLILNVTNSKLHGWTSYSPIQKATFINTEFSKGGSAYDFARPYADTLFENCTFDATFKLGGGATGKTYELNNCTYNGQKLTVNNIKSMLTTTGSDAPLLQCTIIVDGVTVNWN